MERGRPADLVLKLFHTRVVLLLAGIVVAYLLVVAVDNAVRGYQLRQEEARLERQLRDTQYQYQRLEALRDYMAGDEYVETVARRELGLGYPGETNFVVVSPEGEQEESGGREHWWERYFR